MNGPVSHGTMPASEMSHDAGSTRSTGPLPPHCSSDRLCVEGNVAKLSDGIQMPTPGSLPVAPGSPRPVKLVTGITMRPPSCTVADHSEPDWSYVMYRCPLRHTANELFCVKS